MTSAILVLVMVLFVAQWFWAMLVCDHIKCAEQRAEERTWFLKRRAERTHEELRLFRDLLESNAASLRQLRREAKEVARPTGEDD